MFFADKFYFGENKCVRIKLRLYYDNLKIIIAFHNKIIILKNDFSKFSYSETASPKNVKTQLIRLNLVGLRIGVALLIAAAFTPYIIPYGFT